MLCRGSTLVGSRILLYRADPFSNPWVVFAHMTACRALSQRQRLSALQSRLYCVTASQFHLETKLL